VLLGKAREDEHRQVRRPRLDGGERVDPALVGHGQIHQEHVDVSLADEVQCFAAVGGLPRHLEIDLILEILAQAGAHDGMVIDDGDTNHGLHRVKGR
jgi:hypothetical protein